MSTKKLIALGGSLLLLAGIRHTEPGAPLAAATLKRPQVAVRGGRRALLIGISDYGRGGRRGEFDDLHTGRDIEALEKVLQRQFGFRPSDIRKLTSRAQTTNAAILAGIRSWICTVNPGDTILFYYAGHGSVAPDVEEPTGEGQTIVPSDYGDDGSRDIRDKTIAELLLQLHRERKPQSVTVLFDCCHSATLARGRDGTVRGLGWEERYPGRRRPQGITMGRRPRVAPAALPGYVTMSACEDDGEAREMKDDSGHLMGRFTYFLAKALAAAGPETTYQSAFERLQAEMAQHFPDQIPSIEGDTHRRVMDGTAVVTLRYFAVSVDAKHETVLRAGRVHGMTSGSELELYPNGIIHWTPARRLARARVALVGVTESTLRLPWRRPGFRWQDLQGAVAVETRHHYGDNRLKVAVEPFWALPQGDAIVTLLKELDCIQIIPRANRTPDVRLVWITPTEATSRQVTSRVETHEVGRTAALIRSSDGAVLETLTGGPADVAMIRRTLRREAIYRAARLLSNERPGNPMGVQMRIVPALLRADGQYFEWQRDRPWPSTRRALREGTPFTLEVQNTGEHDMWISVLDLQSDGHVTVLWPPKGTPVSQRLPREQRAWHKLWTNSYRRPWPLKVGKPYGVELFKVIATLQPVDFRSLETRGGAATPLEELWQAALMGTRGPERADPKNWGTATCLLQVERNPGHE